MMDNFILTYCAHLNSHDLLDHLMSRFLNSVEETAGNELLKTNISFILFRWFYSTDDFSRDQKLGQKLSKWTRELIENAPNNFSRSIFENVDTSLKKENRKKSFSVNFSLKKGYIVKFILDGLQRESEPKATMFEATDVAKTLTILESSIISNILPNQLINKAWNVKGNNISTENISRYFMWFSKIVNWISSEIVCTKGINNRANVLTWFIQLGKV